MQFRTIQSSEIVYDYEIRTEGSRAIDTAVGNLSTRIANRLAGVILENQREWILSRAVTMRPPRIDDLDQVNRFVGRAEYAVLSHDLVSSLAWYVDYDTNPPICPNKRVKQSYEKAIAAIQDANSLSTVVNDVTSSVLSVLIMATEELSKCTCVECSL